MKNYLKKMLMPDSTYWKFTRSFVLLGLLPMCLICIAFFLRYSTQVETMTLTSMKQENFYIEENISEIIDGVDETMAYLYSYQTPSGEYLYEVIQNETMEDQEKALYYNTMLQTMLGQNSYISSLRFVLEDQVSYAAYYNSEKTSTLEPAFCDVRMFPTVDSYHDLAITPCTAEDYYTSNSTDYVFSLVRNYMNISTTETTTDEVLATLYADVNEDAFTEYIETLDLGITGKVSIYNPETGNYLYCTDKSCYAVDAEDPWEDAQALFVGTGGCEEFNNYMLVYNKLDGTDYYIIISSTVSEVRSTYMENLSFMIVLLFVALFFLVTVYSIYSGHLSEPTRQLKRAMQEVQVGNFDVSVDIHTNDEMEYLGDGFNKMLHALKYYIDQVYVARICRSQAELNTLKAQIRPHYLYNTLDIIRMTALENEDYDVAELLESLSAQMRYLTGTDEELVAVQREIENIREYYTILKVRFKQRITIKMNVADEDLKLKMLKLTLQPLVENAVKHGLRPKGGAGTIEIDVARTESALEITVMDDGVGISPENLKELRVQLLGKEVEAETDSGQHVGIGLKNVMDLIRMKYGMDYGIVIDSYEGMGTIVKMRLPLLEEEENEDVESVTGR